jgi:hypothetical protein
MRHPVILAALRRILPQVLSPALGDLHPSLHNKDVIAAEIKLIQKNAFPCGLDIDGELGL